MERSKAARVAVGFIRDRLVPPISLRLDLLTGATLGRWRQELHVFRHFARAQLDAPLNAEIETLLTTGGNLWRLLADHADALEQIRDYKSARSLSAVSDLVGIGEEVLSGEDVGIREYLLDAAGFWINWLSNTAWVNAGYKAHAAAARNYLPEIQDELWEFVSVSSDIAQEALTLERSQGIGQRIEALAKVIGDASLPTNAQVTLLAFLYQWVLRLRLGRLLMALEQIGGEGRP